MIEQGIKYTFVGEDGTVATIGDPTDPNFCGYLTELPSGMDSPDLRLDVANVTEGHGAVHGAGYAGRKQPGFQGIIVPSEPPASRNAAMEKLTMAAWAVESDGILRWTPTGDAIERAMWYRTNESNPLRFTGRIPKTFQFGLSTEEWRVLSYLLQSPAAVLGVSPVVTATNSGKIAGPLMFTITGPVTNPVVTQSVTGKKIRLTAVIAAGQTRVVYLWPPDPGLLILDQAGVNRDGELDVSQSNLDLAMRPGSNTFTLTGTGTTAATALAVAYRHAWRI